MKIALVGASGNAGQRILAEALSRGHDVTAIGRDAGKLAGLGATAIAAAPMDDPAALAEVLKGHDLVASAVRFVHYRPADLIGAVRASGVPRLAVVGGAGSLMRPDGSGLVADGPAFPAAALPEARAGKAMLSALEAETAIDWTFLSPAAVFAAGRRTGTWRLGQDTLLVAEDSKSHISFEDYAAAFLDEIEHPAHSRRRFAVGY